VGKKSWALTNHNAQEEVSGGEKSRAVAHTGGGPSEGMCKLD
jgi:hypothetical protein